MSFEVRCPACDHGYLVEESFDGGEFCCAACGSSIPLTRPDAQPVAASAPAAAPHAPATLQSHRMPAARAVAGSHPTQAPHSAPITPTQHLPASPAASMAPTAPVAAAANAAQATPTVTPHLHGATAQAAPVVPAPHPGTPTSPYAVAPQPTAPATEVVCPRCQLHFIPREAAQSTPRARRKAILIVEDMVYFKQIAKDALGDDYDVRFAGSNLEARAVLGDGGIDLLVLDLNLENGDQGVDLLRSLPVKPCPILIYTSRDESEMYGEDWAELQRLGADDVLVKGVNVDDSLTHKVARLLGDDIDEDPSLD